MEFFNNLFESYQKNRNPSSLASKSDLITAIIDGLFDAEYYLSVFESIEQESGLIITESANYHHEIEQYKKNLLTNIILYMHETFTENELIQMVSDANSKHWQKMVTHEYRKIINDQTIKFASSLVNK